MPPITQHTAKDLTKVLVIGNSGAGKTALLATLANAGYSVRVWDYDNGLDVVMNYLTPTGAKNFFYHTLVDMPGKPPTAYMEGKALLNGWKSDGFPSITEWGSKDVLVIDSLTFHGRATMAYVLAIGGFTGKSPQIQHWGEAMRLQEELLAVLYSNAVKCNVVVNAHLTFGDDEAAGRRQGYPSALGTKLPPKVGSFFNSALFLEVTGVGGSRRRQLRTASTTTIALKTPAPAVVSETIEPDLAKYFKLVQDNAKKHSPQSPPQPREVTTLNRTDDSVQTATR
jgi:energy-coupling factor transporter ATP-binding protein EcfA2